MVSCAEGATCTVDCFGDCNLNCATGSICMLNQCTTGNCATLKTSKSKSAATAKASRA